jgi:hypothetical protein
MTCWDSTELNSMVSTRTFYTATKCHVPRLSLKLVKTGSFYWIPHSHPTPPHSSLNGFSYFLHFILYICPHKVTSPLPRSVLAVPGRSERNLHFLRFKKIAAYSTSSDMYKIIFLLLAAFEFDWAALIWTILSRVLLTTDGVRVGNWIY